MAREFAQISMRARHRRQQPAQQSKQAMQFDILADNGAISYQKYNRESYIERVIGRYSLFVI